MNKPRRCGEMERSTVIPHSIYQNTTPISATCKINFCSECGTIMGSHGEYNTCCDDNQQDGLLKISYSIGHLISLLSLAGINFELTVSKNNH